MAKIMFLYVAETSLSVYKTWPRSYGKTNTFHHEKFETFTSFIPDEGCNFISALKIFLRA